ncbi:glycosyl hydrolase family 10 protein [Tirmania nivea]|nr:glycosyl hydrolase family 10 protein [Tirmania nivea]
MPPRLCHLSFFIYRPSATATSSPGGLDTKIKGKSKQFFGAAVEQNSLSVSQIDAIVKAEFGVLTLENSMKWESTQGTKDFFTMTNADYLHSQLPSWVSNVANAATLTSVIQNYITTRYKSKIFHWYVCNEVFEDDGIFRNSVFYRLLGEQFIDIAFKAAAAADPSAKLYLNDYNLDHSSAKLISRGFPIHGIGTQTGLDVAITELDIRMTLPSDSTKVTKQSADYTSVTKACLANTKCVGITVWGVDGGHSWVPNTFSGQGDALLWNSRYQKKDAYTAVSNVLN